MGEGFDAESNTPVCEKGNGPSSLKQIQWDSELRLAGGLSAGHTIDSSSAVRVTEEKTPFGCPVRNGCLWIHTHDGVRASKPAESKLFASGVLGVFAFVPRSGHFLVLFHDTPGLYATRRGPRCASNPGSGAESRLPEYEQRDFRTARDYGFGAFLFQGPHHLDATGQRSR
jgi:hypothetical protein